MSEHKLSIAFQTDKPMSEYRELAELADDYGFDTITVYNDMLYQPAWLPLMEIARHSRRAHIGVAAVNPFTTHPINIAGNIALIDEVSEGRAYLGMARGGWLDYIGVYPQRAITAINEAFACVQHLLSGSTEPLEGEIYPIAGGDSLRWSIRRPDIPFLLGTWGLKTIEKCAHHVEEIKLGGSANPDVVPWYRERMRSLNISDDVGLVMGAVTVIDEDGDAARALARREVALYLPVVAALDKTLEIEAEVLRNINIAADAFDFETAAGYISDDLLGRFVLAGTPDEIIRQTEALFDAGSCRVEYGTPHGLSSGEGLRLLGERVLPAFRGGS